MTVIAHYMNGSLVASNSGRQQPVFNPASGVQSATVALGSVDEVNQAVAFALAAWPAWSETAPLRRARVMFKFKALLEQHQEQLAASLRAVIAQKLCHKVEDGRIAFF